MWYFAFLQLKKCVIFSGIVHLNDRMFCILTAHIKLNYLHYSFNAALNIVGTRLEQVVNIDGIATTLHTQNCRIFGLFRFLFVGLFMACVKKVANAFCVDRRRWHDESQIAAFSKNFFQKSHQNVDCWCSLVSFVLFKLWKMTSLMSRKWEVTDKPLGCYYWNRTTSVPKSVPRGWGG